MGLTRINCGHPSSVGLKCSRCSLYGSVRRVPIKMALTDGVSARYASRAGRMAIVYCLRSRWYSFVDSVTNSSISGNGSAGAMYMAWIRGTAASGVGVGVLGLVEASVGRQASSSTSRQRQSFPPL